MRQFIQGLFLVTLFALLSCSNSRKAENSTTETEVAKDSSYVVASIERSACYGRCPTYRADVYNDGKVVYEGKMNVERIGIYESTFSSEEIKFLIDRARDIGYFEMQDKYDGNITDVPVCITFMRDGDKMKTIFNRYEGPAELEEFQKYFDQLLESRDWKFVRKGAEEFQQDQD